MPVRKETTRPQRSRVSGHRDIVNVHNTDPDYYYRWVHDKHGQIYRYLDAGYNFVDREKEPSLQIGEAKVGKYKDLGSVITLPVGRHAPDEVMYLMRQLMEHHKEDTAAEEKDRRDMEKQMFRKYNPDNPADEGQYGEVKLQRS